GGRRRRGDGERDGDGEGREGGGRGRRQRSYPENGILFVGEKGTLFFDRNRPRLYPAADFDGWRLPELEERNHYQEWVSAIRGNGKTSTHFGYAGPLTETVLLGNVALRFPKETLEWDAKAAKVKNISGANAVLERTLREGWDRVATAGRNGAPSSSRRQRLARAFTIAIGAPRCETSRGILHPEWRAPRLVSRASTFERGPSEVA